MGCQPVDAAAATPARTINALLLRQTLAHIETHPDEWNQRTYSACFANHAARLAGGQAVDKAGMLLGAEKGELYAVARDGSHVVPVYDRAENVLGLTSEQALDLFTGANDLDSVRRLVTELIAQVHHLTIRIVPDDELINGEALPDGRSPLEVMENRPGDQPMFHGGERGIPLWRLADHARLVADRLGVDYIDPIDPAALERLTRAEAA